MKLIYLKFLVRDKPNPQQDSAKGKTAESSLQLRPKTKWRIKSKVNKTPNNRLIKTT